MKRWITGLLFVALLAGAVAGVRWWQHRSSTWSPHTAIAKLNAMVAPRHDDVAQAVAAAGGDVEQVAEICDRVVQDDSRLISDVRNGHWPSGAHVAVERLLRLLPGERSAAHECVFADTADEQVSIIVGPGPVDPAIRELRDALRRLEVGPHIVS